MIPTKPPGFRLLLALLAGGCLLALAPANPTELPASPEALNQQAFRLAREGGGLVLAGEEKQAWERFSEAAELMEKISREHPSWNPELVAIRLDEYRTRASALGELAFSLPEGFVRIYPAMSRLSPRPALGRVLADRVEAGDEGTFSVAGYTVELTEVASLLGARCNCPDFVVRGAAVNYACRHIWAVVYSRRLLGRAD